MANESDVWRTSDIVKILNKIGVDNLLNSGSVFFTDFIGNIVRRKLCDFSESSVKELQELKFLLILKVEFRNLVSFASDSFPESDDLIKYCCLSLQSLSCDKIRSHFPLFSDILLKCLLLSNRSHYNETVMNILQECKSNLLKSLSVVKTLHEDSELLRDISSSILANCVILESVLESIRLASETVDAMHEVYSFLACDALCETVIQLTTCGVRDVVVHTLTSLIPKLCIFNGSIFSNLWLEICNTSKHILNDSNKATYNLLYLCALAEYYIPVPKIDDRFLNLVSSVELWNLLQEGLVHTDSTVRKQALYLLKRTIDSIMQNKLVVEAGNGRQILFSWQPSFEDELISMWEKYFVVLETLEETQIHLIRPVLEVAEELVPKSPCFHSINHPGLHVTWVSCMLERILHHENSLVIKWGIVHLNYYKFLVVSEENNCVSKIIISFVKALNDSTLYYQSQEGPSAVDLKNAIEGILTSVTSLPPHKAQDVFLEILIAANKIQWGPVPVFYFCHALASVPGTETKVLNSQSVCLLEEFVRTALSNQIVFIRAGVQCFLIQTITNLIDSRTVDLLRIANILGCFRSSESLKRGTSAWDIVVVWLKTFVDADVAQNLVLRELVAITGSACQHSSVAESCLARIMVLLWDADCMPSPFDCKSNLIEIHMLKVVDNFHDADRRLYANAKVQEACLKLLVSLLDESDCAEPFLDDRVRKIILYLARKSVSGVVAFLLRRMVTVSDLTDYDTINFLVSALKTFSKSSELSQLLHKELELLKTTARSILCGNDPPVRKYFASHVLVWTLEFSLMYSEATDFKSMSIKEHEQFLLKIINEKLLTYVPIRNEDFGELTRDSNTVFGRVISGYMCNVWSIVATYLRATNDDENIVVGVAATSIIDSALDGVQLGGKDILPPVLEVVGHFLSCTTSDNLENVSKLLSLCWKTMFELRKTELFWHAFRAFINAVFTESVLRNTFLLPLIVQYAHNILEHGENVPRLPNVLLQKLNDEVHRTSTLLLDPLSEILAEALVFGPVHRKDLRVVNETCEYIESLGTQLSVNVLLESECQANIKVRALAVGLLLHLASSPDGHQIALRVMEYLKEKDKVASARKPFYHKDSHLHRLKHRILQVLLVLEPILPLPQSQEMVTWLCDCLLNDNPQPSVRYQQEWLLVRLLHKHPQLCDSLWDATQRALETRVGSMCSYISVLFHVACSSTCDQEQFVDRTMQEILPCLMGHHFIVRTYAKVALIKLFKLCKEQQFDHLVSKYSTVERALHLRLEQGNAVRTLDKLLDEFYFSIFNPIQHFTIETVFYDLPRLANVTQEEWIPMSVFESLSQFATSIIPLKNSDATLSDFNAADWIVKSTAQEDCGSIVQTQVTIQKKIVPWKSMIPSQEDGGRAVVDGGLVVVASLIDRSPNLGGLSRTCEVFGVSQYVLGSLKYAEDKQFQSLSVNADKWISMLEVKPHMLPQYMQAMKQDGYLVVGIEQTDNSTRLDKMKFPKKSLLLLGNEKEGIPANLLPLMDVCVQVPQYGLTRSLNVHVTGAIVIWEYYQQHLLGA